MADKRLNIKVRTDGAKRSKKELKGVEGGIKSLGVAALKTGATFFGAAGLITAMKSFIKLAAEQELAEKKLETALGRVSQSLLDQASALQKHSMFGDEEIITQQAFLASLKMTEEQIRTIIPVAIDLAAATGMSLESAVRNTAKTFSGLAGELGELIPQLRDLTAEEMKAGEAVGIMAELFGGQAKEQTDTLAGSIRQLEMAVGDAGEAFGELMAPGVEKTATHLTTLAEVLQDESIQDFFSETLPLAIKETNPSLKIMNDLLDKLTKGLERRKKQQEEAAQIGVGEQLDADPLGLIESKVELKHIITDIKRDENLTLEAMELQLVTYKEINSNAEKVKNWTEATASSLMTSAIMGDNVAEALKRAVLQMIIMVAQAKLYDHFMTSATGGTNKIFAAIGNFLFGASPTQAFPSPSGPGAKITINQNFGGMGVIDHNFAANSIIPAINKAINTGQARIG